MSIKTKTKLIYVLGAAYSGSTLMGLALGEHPQVINLGEVVNLESDYSDNARCTCKQSLKNCPFWSHLRHFIDENSHEVESFNLSSSGKREHLDRRGGLEKVRLLLGKSMISSYSADYLDRYRKKNENFFSSVSSAFADAEYLVDLSKSAERLEVLLSSDQLDIWCIYLRRSPLKIYASTLKRPKKTRKFLGPKNVREAIWLRTRIRDMDKTFSKIPDNRRIEVDFDQFTAYPDHVLNEILGMLGLSPVRNGNTRELIIHPSNQHLYVGNRWLFNPDIGDIVIKERNDIAKLSKLEQLIFRTVWGNQKVYESK